MRMNMKNCEVFKACELGPEIRIFNAISGKESGGNEMIYKFTGINEQT